MKPTTRQPAENTARAALIRPLVCILALAAFTNACGPKRTVVRAEPPRFPTPATVDTASPPQTRPTRELVLLGTTDLHNRVYPFDYYTRREVGYGLARLKPLIDSVRAANFGRTYLFDSGDILQGNPLGFVFARQHPEAPNPMMRAMNLLGYSASTIGNHEYNYGLAHLDRALGQAAFPVVTANVFKHGTQQHAYKPYALIPHVVAPGDTIMIGVTGNTPPGVHVWDKSNVEGILQFRDIVQSLHPVVREMKERGADVIVVLSHGGLGGTSYDTVTTGLPRENAVVQLAESIPAIDVIFMGHTHQEVRDTTINGVLLTQAKNWAQSLANVKLRLERRAAGNWLVIAKSAQILKPDPARADTAFLDSMRWHHERTVAYVKSVAGKSTARMEARDARWKDTPFIDFINEVQRKAAGTDLSAAAPFDINAVIPQGTITISDVAGAYIYDNTLRAIRITGAQLKAYLEKSAEYYSGYPATDGSIVNPRVPGYNFDIVSGVDYTIDIARPVGQRITDLLYNRQPVRDDQTFTMALNNYRQSGGGGYGMIANAPVVYDKQEDIRELIIEEIKRKGTIRPEDYFKPSWQLRPEAARAEAASATRASTNSSTRTGAPAVKRLRVLSTNDIHGRLLPETFSWSGGRPVGGLAALTAYLKMEAEGFDGPTIILDGGDVMQGTPISNLTRGRSTIAALNATGLTASAIGNHEYDWKIPILRERISQAKFPWLSANTFVKGTTRHPAWVKPTAMVTAGNTKVGIIGLSTEGTPETTMSTNVTELSFGSGISAIDKYVPILRAAGADFVIVVAHAGAICDRDYKKCDGEIIDWARGVKQKPDLMVAGHTHRTVRYSENGIPIVESGSYTTRYGVTDLVKDSTGLRSWIHEFPVPFADGNMKDAAVDRIVQAAQREIGPQVERVIATFADTIRRGQSGDGALGNLLADAFRVGTGSQMSFVNNGSIRVPEIPAGPVKWGQLYSLQPFENAMTRLTLSGSAVREVVEQSVSGGTSGMHISGLKVEFDPKAEVGKRVVRMTLSDGTEVTPGGSYLVGVTTFLATGTGDGYTAFGKASAREDLPVTDLELLIRYVQSLPQPVRADRTRRYQTTSN